MKKIVFLLCFITLQIFASPLDEARKLYKNAAFEKPSCENLLKLTEIYSIETNPILTAYYACATMIMAKHILNPFKKLAYFNSGKKLLEQCINKNSKNIEICFLRFSIQNNAPSFLDYKHSIKTDKIFLKNSIADIKDEALKQLILTVLNIS